MTVIIPSGRTVEVDGHPKTADYSGWYFDTVPVNLRAATADGGDFSYWRVDGKTVSEPEVELRVGKNTLIEAVFAEAANAPQTDR